jgi:hypothetical protein
MRRLTPKLPVPSEPDGNGLVAFRARVAHRGPYEPTLYHVNHDEDKFYQGVLVRHDLVRLGLAPVKDPLPATSLHLHLEFDVSHWTDVADPELEAEYDKAAARFRELCDAYTPGELIEIVYSVEERAKTLRRRPGSSARSVPLSHHPFGFETFTSTYTRERREDYPEVRSVTRIVES